MDWIQEHFLTIMQIVWGVDQILKVIAPLTKNKVDDNIADWVGKAATKFFPKKP